MRGDFCQHLGEPRFQRLAADNYLAPVSMEEFPLQLLETKSQIAFQKCEEREAVGRTTVNEHAIDIDHHTFIRQIPSLRNGPKVTSFVWAIKSAVTLFCWPWSM